MLAHHSHCEECGRVRSALLPRLRRGRRRHRLLRHCHAHCLRPPLSRHRREAQGQPRLRQVHQGRHEGVLLEPLRCPGPLRAHLPRRRAGRPGHQPRRRCSQVPPLRLAPGGDRRRPGVHAGPGVLLHAPRLLLLVRHGLSVPPGAPGGEHERNPPPPRRSQRRLEHSVGGGGGSTGRDDDRGIRTARLQVAGGVLRSTGSAEAPDGSLPEIRRGTGARGSAGASLLAKHKGEPCCEQEPQSPSRRGDG
mmetsp:Transcript_12733/g.50871  ORF Transcript_12733/g.50871 Transcript_12733/m.50871 type:complete len:249 (+) Transcript_12733:422-1168(+)